MPAVLMTVLRKRLLGACFPIVARRRYLKNVYREKTSQADPVADDLATWALYLLVERTG
jgi:hypothetical protein